MIKLYTSRLHPQQWIAYVPESGWTVFPAQDQGWERRQPARGLDPVHLREVPLTAAAGTGLPQTAPVQAAALRTFKKVA